MRRTIIFQFFFFIYFSFPVHGRGIWNVPFISTAYLIKSSLLNLENLSANENNNHRPLSYRNHQQHKNDDNDDEKSFDADMYFCQVLRDNGIFMYVTNLKDYGHLAQMDTMDVSLKHPEFYEIYTNEYEWRKRYIHENYSTNLLDETIIEQPCPDVYWFPIVTPTFCRHLIGLFFILRILIFYFFLTIILDS